MKKNYLFLYTIFLMVIIFSSVFIVSDNVIAALRIEPSRIILNVLENKNATGLIEVVNTGDREVELTVLLNDWSLDERDAIIYLEAGQNDYSLNNLIKFNPKIFTLGPGKKQVIRFTISSPEQEIVKERRGIVFVEHESDFIDEATGSRVKTQVGTVIYYIPEGVKYNFKFLGLRVYKSSEPMPQRIALNIKNDGDGHIRYYPSYKIVDSENKVVMENKFNELLILPGYERQISFYLEDRLFPGNYKILLEFDLYNTNRKAEYQIPIKIE